MEGGHSQRHCENVHIRKLATSVSLKTLGLGYIPCVQGGIGQIECWKI